MQCVSVSHQFFDALNRPKQHSAVVCSDHIIFVVVCKTKVEIYGVIIVKSLTMCKGIMEIILESIMIHAGYL